MRAIILAAGQGTRLRPLTDDRPKCLVEIGGRTLLDRQLETLKQCGIHDIIVVTGYKAQHIRALGVKTCHNPRYKTTNMVESLFCAKKYMDRKLIVSYGDIIYEPVILKKLLKSKQDISVVVDLNWKKLWGLRFENPLEDAESLIYDTRGRILQIGQKTRTYNDIMAQYIGLMKFTQWGLEILKKSYNNACRNIQKKQKAFGKFKSIQTIFMTDLLQGIIDEGCSVHAVKVRGAWLEIDSITDVMLFEKVFRHKKALQSSLK